ncbi:uncharacterized protein LOC123542144 isoform X2 [Mercenaria mercenaria]|uniref:uncharacterized protein LOC123542144 isoform X2 n=1 Tax=Mercenaria mercenaria TaxID=6596 RepID=UPI00234E83BC|nr:uncharacterized protein LOC123542144 isoform X2 [Mercenaria mercenaria]
MDSDDIRVFIDKLNLQLNLFSFDWMAPIPMSFSDLSRANRVSDKAFRSLNLPKQFRGKLLKDLLKTVETGRLKPMGTDTACSSSKRKQSSSSFGFEPAAKCMRTEQHDSKEEDCQSGSSTAENQDLMKCGEEEPECEDQLDFKDKKVCDAIQNLNAFLEKENLESLRIVLRKSRDEGELEIGLGIHLFTKLAGKAATNKRKSLRKCPCGCLENISGEENMWIGSQSTWYGELDILTGNPIKGDSVSVSFDQETEDGDIDMHGTSKDVTEQFECEDVSEEGDQGESPGDGTNVEVKYSGLRLRPALNQIEDAQVIPDNQRRT